MTPEGGPPDRLGALGRRLVMAFTAVAAVAIALVTAAALIGTDRGLASQLADQQQVVATNLAEAAATAYTQAGGWAGADLSAVRAVVSGTGTRAMVLDASGAVVSENGMGRRAGRGVQDMGPGMPDLFGDAASVTARIRVDGLDIGTVILSYPLQVTNAGRPVAWSWVLLAAAAALALALIAGVLAARQLTRPLLALTKATRAFAAGDRTARPAERGAGELGELAVAFDEAATAVQTAESARRQMAADVAHELRTPLAAVQAGLEELRDGLAPADSAALARLHDQALRLGRVVGDLAELSAAEAAGQGMALTNLERLDLAELAQSECTARAPQLRAAGLELRTELAGPTWVRADPHRLHQVVGNLLENCARHCESGDTVVVSVQPGRATPDGATPGPGVLRVADTGPGIAADDLPHVLTRFWRSPTARNRSTGSGLGLAIVAELVRAHGGGVDVASPTTPDGRGTTVSVTLPSAADR